MAAAAHDGRGLFGVTARRAADHHELEVLAVQKRVERVERGRVVLRGELPRLVRVVTANSDDLQAGGHGRPSMRVADVARADQANVAHLGPIIPQAGRSTRAHRRVEVPASRSTAREGGGDPRAGAPDARDSGVGARVHAARSGHRARSGTGTRRCGRVDLPAVGTRWCTRSSSESPSRRPRTLSASSLYRALRRARRSPSL